MQKLAGNERQQRDVKTFVILLSLLLLASIWTVSLIGDHDTLDVADENTQAPVPRRTMPDPVSAPTAAVSNTSISSSRPAADTLYSEETEHGPSHVNAARFEPAQDDVSGLFPAHELRDPDWAPGMEATLDSVIRSMGGPIRDVKRVECRTTKCRVLILYHPSVFLMDEATREEFAVDFHEDFSAAMAPVFQASDRLSQFSGAAFAQLSSETIPDESNLSETIGASLTISGPLSPAADAP